MKHRFQKAGSLLVQIAILLVLFTIAFILLIRANLIELPSFFKNLFQNEQEVTTEVTTDEQNIFQYIDGSPDNLNVFSEYPEITTENMNSLLNSLVPQKNFYWESTSETFSGSASVAKNCISRISGNRYNV